MYRRIERELFKFTERCVREYNSNLADINEQREYLRSFAEKSPSDFKDIARIEGGEDVPKIQRWVEMLDRDAKLHYLEPRVLPIMSFLATLGDDDKRLLDLRYWQNKSWTYISEELHVSESTARRWRNKMICRIAQLLLPGLA